MKLSCSLNTLFTLFFMTLSAVLSTQASVSASTAATSPVLTLPANVPIPSNLSVSLSITYANNGNAISSTAFSVDFDETCLDFDPADGDGDGTPDAVAFSVPGDFVASVTYAAGDTSGELDFVFADFSPPLASLPDGALATVRLTPTCVPVSPSILAAVDFGLQPPASFGDTTGQSVPGTTVNGSVEILPGIPGDCNADGVVDGDDLSACVAETFDGDGSHWTAVVGGSFLGSPVGCDANQDFLVDAGDFSCKPLLIAGGPGACLTTLPPVSLFEEQRLTASDATSSDLFGDSVAISGDLLVVGAREENVDTGAAYLFERNGFGLWQELRKITASDAATGDFFGDAAAFDGDTIVIGASLDDDLGSASGSVYVFQRNQGGPDNWGELRKITASDADTNDQFGTVLALSGDTLVVGARSNDDAGNASGAAYIFERNEGGADGWGEVRKITASDAAEGDNFGHSVAVAGDFVVIGAFRNDALGAGSGAAYLFERDAGGVDKWGEILKFTAADTATGDAFGVSVALSGDTAVVGATGADAAGNNAGAVYIFERDHGGLDNWGQLRKLTASDAAPFAGLGRAAAIDGDTLMARASLGDSSGAVYVFQRDAGGSENWGEILKLPASAAAPEDEFGFSVALSGQTLLVGSRLDDDEGFNSGSAFVYSAAIPGPTLAMPALIPSPTGVPVSVPITFTGNGHDVAAKAFSVDLGESCLAFDPSDADGDGIPDAVTFTLPGHFTPSVTYSAGDTSGELDFSVADVSAPLAALPDGVFATITLTPTCVPAGTSLIAPVGFGALPAASFGDTAGRSVEGTTQGGSVEILPGIPGDCNADGVVDSGDISACVLEVFDGDGNAWTNVSAGSFPGSPVGCDANQDFFVDAGDFACKILLIFNGAGACTAPAPPSDTLSELRIGTASSSQSGEEVTLPLTFSGNGQAITASAFSIDYDETCLAFDPSDGLSFILPPGISPSVRFDASATAGELGISFLDPVPPLANLQDGEVARLTFTTLCDLGEDGSEAAVRFGAEPMLSFGNVSGRSGPGVGVNGGVGVTSTLFLDGFESGDTTGWSGAIP